jgi:membrane fusion protein, multidrug efflux system
MQMRLQKKIFIVLAGVVLFAGVGKGWSELRNNHPEKGDAAPAEAGPDKGLGDKNPNDKNAGDKGPGKKGGKPLFVAVEQVRPGTIHVYHQALGTVTSFATVAVKSRVNGQLTAINFREGQLVKAGDVLARIDARPFEAQLSQIQGQHIKDKALLANAIADLDRYQTLLKQDSIAGQQVDAQASLVQQYKGTVLSDSGAVENAQLQVAYTRVIAPVSGRIGLRQIDAGNNITTADTVAVINQISPIAVTFTLPENMAQEISRLLDQRAVHGLPVQALDKGNTRLLAEGKLLTLDNQIDPATGTIKLKAQFANADSALFPNQFVNIKILLNTLQQVNVLPQVAIQHGSQGHFVYLVDAQDKLHIQPVTTGPADGDQVAVLKGVNAGDRVVVSGLDKLRDGAKVVIAGSGKDKGAGKSKGNHSQSGESRARHS